MSKLIILLVVSLNILSFTECEYISLTDKTTTPVNSDTTKNTIDILGNVTILDSPSTTKNTTTTDTTVITTTAKTTTTKPITTETPTTNATTTIPTTTTTITTTTTPKTTTTPSTPSCKHFDGGSFVGGMVLSASLLIIGYFAYKYYMQRKNTPYRNF